MVEAGNTRVRLKRAKELIDEQKWDKAQDILQRICEEDGGNAPALLLSGKCALELQQRDKSLQQFRRALATQSELLAAWQGLLAWHKRFAPTVAGEVEDHQLLEGYRRCLEALEKDEQQAAMMKPKVMEYLQGYAPLLAATGKMEEALTTWGRLAELATGYGNKETRLHAYRAIIRAIVPLPNKHQTDFLTALPPDRLQLLLTTFDALLSEYDVATLEDGYAQEHLSVMLRLQRLVDAETLAHKYREQYKEMVPFAVAVLYMLQLERDLRGQPVKEPEMNALQETVASWDAQHPLVRIKKALTAYRQHGFAKCCELLEKALLSAKGWSSLPTAYHVPLLQHIDLLCRKYLAIAWICVGGERLADAVTMMADYASRMPQPDWEVYFYSGFAQFILGRTAAAEATQRDGSQAFAGQTDRSEQMLVDSLKGIFCFDRGDFQAAADLLESALLVREDNYLFHYYLFRCLWDAGQRDPRRCLKHLKRALQLYPDFAVAHMYLGLWTWLQDRDIEAARSHLVKSHALLPNDPVIVRTLTDYLTVAYKDVEAVQILQQALSSRVFSYEAARWMRLRLALLCYRNKLWMECISYLRQSIVDFPQERLVQELLGDALAFRGNYGSAEGTFAKVVEKFGSAPELTAYSSYRRATIKQTMKMDEEAELELVLLREQSPWFRYMCLQNLALLSIGKAQLAFEEYRPREALQAIQTALDLLTEIVLSGNVSVMVWTILGDACLLARHCRPGSAVPCVLLIDQFLWDGSPSGQRVELNARQAIYLATLFYSAAIGLKRASARLWERLTMAYLALAERLALSAEKDAAHQWWNKSLLAAKEMLQRNPLDPSLWTTLGMVLTSSVGKSGDSSLMADAARSLTKSLQLYNRARINPTCTAASWTCLGYLLLNAKRYIPAHKMLKLAQNADPGQAAAWLGQAWCAERTGHTLEAMDLCRHACALGRPHEAMHRYAEWVVWVLLKSQLDQNLLWEVIGRLDAVPTALDYLGQYKHIMGESSKSCMLTCILAEWAGLLRTGLDQAQNALQLCAETGVAFGKHQQKLVDESRLNLARFLSEINRHSEALDMLSSVESEPSRCSILLLLLVHFRLGNYEDADGLIEVLTEMDAGDAQFSGCVQMLRCVVKLYWLMQSGGVDAGSMPEMNEATPFAMRQRDCYRSLIGEKAQSTVEGLALLLAVPSGISVASRMLHMRPERPDVRLYVAEALQSFDMELAQHFAFTAIMLNEWMCGDHGAAVQPRHLATGANRIPYHSQLQPNILHFLLKDGQGTGQLQQQAVRLFPWLIG
ncbi:SKI3 subunit of superkiller complex protein-like [Paramacrobiotus metropolitanus]|uniref:SKI3 subunit of superkiller complex protein-like n=1 Tax=Paramacrobiotus metropolitanus TaxID=2943436 RepID=UPI0024463D1C|nr:SKI3 subunit of superkiller complex protein-like [Paramacrobiotus metropolitanus]